MWERPFTIQPRRMTPAAPTVCSHAELVMWRSVHPHPGTNLAFGFSHCGQTKKQQYTSTGRTSRTRSVQSHKLFSLFSPEDGVKVGGGGGGGGGVGDF